MSKRVFEVLNEQTGKISVFDTSKLWEHVDSYMVDGNYLVIEYIDNGYCAKYKILNEVQADESNQNE